MSQLDRQKWNARYADEAAAPSEPSRLVTGLDGLLPRKGRALDVAGGAGRHAIWLAGRGLDVTLADVSEAGLALAEGRAAATQVKIKTCRVDLEADPFPAGPWDLILSFHYLHRPLFAIYPQVLAASGLLVIVQPTKRNLERHPKPPAPYLLEEGELSELARGLDVEHYEEGWLAEGRQEALLIARKS